MTPEERAKALVLRVGGADYYYEGWADEESIASAIRSAEREARAAAYEFAATRADVFADEAWTSGITTQARRFEELAKMLRSFKETP